jgi:cytochrome c-type biogenesis protein CcmH
MRVLAFALALGLLAGGVFAQPADNRPEIQLADPALEARARDIARNIRCLVCQNQSIEDSNADLARDLRTIVRERVQAGDDRTRVEAYLVARYGDWVLLKPPLKARTFALWLGPAVLLAAGALGVAFYFRRRRKLAAPTAPLSDAETARLKRLLDDGERR